jgi:hypothetical protein
LRERASTARITLIRAVFLCRKKRALGAKRGYKSGMTSNCLRFPAWNIPAAVALLAVAGCQSFSDSAPSFAPVGAGARVAEVRGGARWSDASHPWRKLSVGDTLPPGSLIQTALASAADLAVNGAGAGGAAGTRVLLQPDTVLFVEGLPGASAAGAGGDGAELRLHLRLGWLTFTSPTSGPVLPCEIRFANGFVGARGAAFNLRSDGQVTVLRGEVVVKLLNDQPARTITAGNRFDPQTGQVTSVPAGQMVEKPVPPSLVRPPAQPWPPWPTRKY